MNLDMLLAGLVSFAVTAALGPFVIRFLTRKKMEQTERTDGVAAHLKKAGTPTMGGIMFWIGILISSLVFAGRYPRIIPVLVLTLGFGAIGFVDDYLKAFLHRSDGLLAWQKLLLQIVVTTIFWIFLTRFSGIDLAMRIPFGGGRELNPGWLALPILYFAVLGTVNGTNFTDGVDGLSSSVTTVVAVFFTIASLQSGGGIECISCAMAGGLLAFLLYNCYPAKIFMGDTGSLALGGFVAGSAYMLKMPLFILIVGLIYLLEVLSVILQVGYFKLTHGKRIFKMAPIHHHFELSGWSETRVVTVFTVVTVLMCVLGLLAM